MKVVIFGASGMVGQGVLRECLITEDVEQVIAVGRGGAGQVHRKLREFRLDDLTDLSSIEDQLAGADACFYCLGVTSAGRGEAEYSRITYDFTMAAATTLARLNPELTFIYVSGAGTDSTEKGRVMWARVKGRTENAVLALFRNGYAFRPGIIRPLHGARSKTRAYRAFYTVATPFWPLLRRVFAKSMTTTERIGEHMLEIARHGHPKRVLETTDLT